MPAIRSALKSVLALALAYALVIGGVLTSFAGAAGGLQFPVCSAGSVTSGHAPAGPAGRDTAAHDCCIGACGAAAAALLPGTVELGARRPDTLALRKDGEPIALKPIVRSASPRAPPATA